MVSAPPVDAAAAEPFYPASIPGGMSSHWRAPRSNTAPSLAPRLRRLTMQTLPPEQTASAASRLK